MQQRAGRGEEGSRSTCRRVRRRARRRPCPAVTSRAARLLPGNLNLQAMLVEQAGGKASTGTARSLEMMPDSIHGRCGPPLLPAVLLLLPCFAACWR